GRCGGAVSLDKPRSAPLFTKLFEDPPDLEKKPLHREVLKSRDLLLLVLEPEPLLRVFRQKLGFELAVAVLDVRKELSECLGGKLDALCPTLSQAHRASQTTAFLEDIA